MFVLVLAAEADETRQAITFLIVCLVGIAALLAALTVWYWIFTSPKRRATQILNDLGHFSDEVSGAEEAERVLVGASVAGAGSGGPDILSESTALLSSMLTGGAEDLQAAPAPTKPPSTEQPPAPEQSVPLTASPAVDQPPVAGMSPAVKQAPSTAEPRRIEVGDRSPAGAGATDRSLVACTAERSSTGTIKPAVERAAVTTRRTGPADELARVRNRRISQARPVGGGGPGPTAGSNSNRPNRPGALPGSKRPASTPSPEALSDDDWAAVMKSAFDKLHG